MFIQCANSRNGLLGIISGGKNWLYRVLLKRTNWGIRTPERNSIFYQSVNKVLSNLDPREVIETVKASQLRGRGGAGFPTGKKWEFTAQESEQEKYVICNADEGVQGLIWIGVS